jgi:hypothetical protein
MDDDDSLGTQPDFELVTTYSDGVYTSIISVDNSSIQGASAEYDDTASFGASEVVDISSGDVFSISIAIENSNSQYIEDLLTLSIVGTGDVNSASWLLTASEDGDYDASFTATEDSSIQLQFGLNGTATILQDASVAISITISITRPITPILCSTASSVISIYDEDIYLHNDNTTRCYFYNTQFGYAVRVYSTENPSIIKQFDSIAIHTNKPFDVSDIQIPISPNYDNGMQSRIKEARFEKEEGVYRSNYLCNMKTTSATANVKDLFTGDTLRGYYIYHDLDGDETVKHTLYKVDVLSTPSKY